MKGPTLASLSLKPLGTRRAASDQPRYLDSEQASTVSAVAPATPATARPLQNTVRRPPSAELAQFIVRLPLAERRRLHQVALELDMSAQDLVLAALAEYLSTRGLRPLG